jgi:5-methylcytosine-specific restriction endonuclease McrA
MKGILSRWQRTKARTRERCQEKRAAMVAALGGCCENCGSVKKLEFHHTVPRTWCASNHNQWTRLNLYQHDIKAGHIVLLCKRCNISAGKP